MVAGLFNRRRLLTAGMTTALLPTVTRPRHTTAQPATPPASPTLPPMPDATPRAGGPLSVMTTTPILADITRQAGGARVESASLVPANADPHEYEPKPADIVKLDDADLIVEHGLRLDAWVTELVKSSSNHHVIVATTGVKTLASGEGDFAEGDPHVWFDPTNVMVMATNIATALSDRDLDGANDYAARTTAYAAQLDELDAWIAAQIATIPPERRKLVTNHDAFGYYVARYGLTFVGSVIPSFDAQAEPSASETAKLIERIKQEGVPAIFTETTINPKLEEELAKEAGVLVVPDLYSDTLGPEGSGADTYIGMMIVDTSIIVNALR